MTEQKTQQLTLDLSNDQSFDADEYIVLPANQKFVQQLINEENLPQTSPLTILFGMTQSGKTHLAHVWQHHFNAQFLPDEYLKVDDVNITELAKIIGQGAIIIDDIDQKPLCEKTIFHIINMAIQAKQRLLFTSSKPLLLWDIALPDLLSRLKAAKHIEITAPDDMLLETILIKSFAEKQLNVPENVIAYILPRTDRSIAAIVKLVGKIDEYALQENKPITRTMVAKMYDNDLI
ncbi:MAG: hypothetical protein COC24_006775 [Alphaproteobacteria bacterium]|nr:hypothetical protein [Alphaproteobacteria bacterium]